MSLQQLPPELIVMIGKSCNTQVDLLALSRVNRQCNNLLAGCIIPYNIEHCRSSGLHHAAVTNDLVLARRFLGTKKVNVNIAPFDRSEAAPETQGALRHLGFWEDQIYETPLWMAITSRHDELALLLLDHGADPNTVNSSKTTSVIYSTIFRGQLTILQKLIEKGVDASKMVYNPSDQPQFHSFTSLATYLSNPAMVRMLFEDIEAGYPHLVQEHGLDGLERAAIHGNVAIAHYFLGKGIPVAGPPGNTSRTPFYAAVMYGKCDIMRLLLHHGAELDHNLMSFNMALFYGHGNGRFRSGPVSRSRKFKVFWGDDGDEVLRILLGACSRITDPNRRARLYASLRPWVSPRWV